jgi:WD40 repeat protein
MTGQEALGIIDRLLEQNHKGRLKPIQLAVVLQVWERNTYQSIGTKLGYEPDYIKQIASELWQLLSGIIGAKVSKSNLCSILQNYRASLITTDWGEKIDVSQFYGRTTELAILSHWILGERCRVVTILGIGGIGKTALSVKLAAQLQGDFEYVIWRSLRNAPALPYLLADIIALLSRQQEIAIAPNTHISRLIHYLQQHRCLLILDNVESILLSERPRQYLAGYESYGKLFRQVGECAHQSCLLLTSREQIAEVATFAGENLPIRVFPLQGLSIDESMMILEGKGLPLTIDESQQLVDLYAGNPLALKIISTSILELFDGQISDFFEQGAGVFNGIRLLLDRQFDRLSAIEAQIMYWLAVEREWVSMGELRADIIPAISTAQLLESLEYLQGRSLIEKKRGKFTQQPVVMEYTIDKLLTAIRTEIRDRNPNLLLRYSLMKATAKDYVRESQTRIVIQPLLMMLQADLGGEQAIDRTLKQILQQLSNDSFSAASYGAGNCLNLLSNLQADVTGLNLSGLSIRQADLRDLLMHQVNFTQANLTTSLFAESIGDIFRVVVSPDDRLVANACSDGRISIWQKGSGQNLLNIKAHGSYVVGIVFTNDSRKLISASLDRFIKIWDLDSGVCLQSWQSSNSVHGLALNHDGQILACGSECGGVLLWDVATGKLLKSLTGHTASVISVAFQPHGTLLASSSYDSTIKLWDLTTDECIITLIGHTQITFSVAFNPLGTKLVSSSFDTSIKLWDVQTGCCLQTMQDHSRIVVAAVFSPDGHKIISGSQDLTLRIWSEIHLNNWQCTKVLQGHHNNIWSIALDSSGKNLISGDSSGVLKFWDVESGRCVKTLSSISRTFRSLAFHPNGNLLASSSEDRQIRLWDLNKDRCLSTIPAHEMSVWQIAFSAQGDRLASCSMDGVVKLWDVIDSSSLGKNYRTVQKNTAFILTIAFHPHAEILASGSVDNTIWLWNYRTGELLRKFDRLELGDIKILNLAFHPAGQLLATAGHDPNIRIWNVETGTCDRILEGHTISHNWSVTFHPQQDLLASGGEDCTIRIWDIHTGKCAKVLNGHTNGVTSVGFSPDGAYLASASKDCTIRIWDVATWKCIKILAGHTDFINFAVYHPNPQRRLLASCSNDETIRLWDTDTGECINILRPQGIYEGMNITGAIGITTAQQATLQALGAIHN